MHNNPRLLARYHPGLHTLEFDLADAPLVEAVIDASVLSTHAVPSLESLNGTAVQKGLFYGKDTFLFEDAFVFDADRTCLLCWLRIREYSYAALLELSTDSFSNETRAVDACAAPRVRDRECLVVLNSNASADDQNSKYLYFTSCDVYLSESVTEMRQEDHLPLPLSMISVAPPAAIDDIVLLFSAVALCYEF